MLECAGGIDVEFLPEDRSRSTSRADGRIVAEALAESIVRFFQLHTFASGRLIGNLAERTLPR